MHYDPNSQTFAGEKFIASLKLLKEKIIPWDSPRHKNWDSCLKKVELDINLLFSKNVNRIFSEEELQNLKAREARKENLLRQKEMDWRMKNMET